MKHSVVLCKSHNYMNYYAIHAVTLFTLAPSAAMDFVHDWVTFNAGYSVS